jgi:hypothetical protein
MMVKIKCPKCGADSSVSFVDQCYQGPHKCWKCRELFTIVINNNQLMSCEPLSQEEYIRRQEFEALRDKFKRNIT